MFSEWLRMGPRLSSVLWLLALWSVWLAVAESHVVRLGMNQYSESDVNSTRVDPWSMPRGWPGDLESYSGYITVDSVNDVNLFFWFCKTKKVNASAAPVLLWLNGGPSVPSMIGAMLENGPLELLENGTLVERKHAWTNEFHMLYIDNPVGTGYSYSSKIDALDNMGQVGQHLLQAMVWVVRAFPNEMANGLYIGGSSYAGKYIPVLGKRITEHNTGNKDPSIPLKGVYITGGLCDAKTMFPVWPDALYSAGLMSKFTCQEYQAQLQGMINRSLAAGFVSQQDFGIPFNDKVVAASGDGDMNSLLGSENTLTAGRKATLQEFMNLSCTRDAFHVDDAKPGNYVTFNADVAVKLMTKDWFIDTREESRLLMDNGTYKVLFSSGNLDMLVTVTMVDAFLDTVDWRGREELRRSQYSQWWRHDRLIGWYATIGNFTRVIVRNAGHHLTYDQPFAALEMMKSFVYDLPY